MHMRIARPVSSLEPLVAMYRAGLALQEIGRFSNHDDFDGVMLGLPELPYHFEFTYCHRHPVRPTPTPEDLVVFYLPDESEWLRRCAAMLAAGFKDVPPFNSYWRRRGKTFEDVDGYRVVLQQSTWPVR